MAFEGIVFLIYVIALSPRKSAITCLSAIGITMAPDAKNLAVFLKTAKESKWPSCWSWQETDSATSRHPAMVINLSQTSWKKPFWLKIYRLSGNIAMRTSILLPTQSVHLQSSGTMALGFFKPEIGWSPYPGGVESRHRLPLLRIDLRILRTQQAARPSCTPPHRTWPWQRAANQLRHPVFGKKRRQVDYTEMWTLKTSSKSSRSRISLSFYAISGIMLFQS